MQNEDPNAFGGPTMTIEDKIKLFAELPGDERREVEQYVEAHGDERPHLTEMLRQSKQMTRLLAGARSLGADPPDDEALAFYAAMRSVDAERMPSEYVEAFDRIRSRLGHDPQLRRRLEELERRGAELQWGSDPEAQFARLSGHGAVQETKRSDRSPSRRPRRRIAVGAAAVAILYAGLFVIGRVSQPDHERLARFESEELVVEGYENVRGTGAQTATDPATAYIRALEHLREAQVSTLGLFPRFQEARLDSAATLLREVIDQEPEDSFLATEAQYFLGRTELARGNVTSARTRLEQVAATPGVRSSEARVLIQQIDEL